MAATNLLERVCRLAGLSRAELARRAGTSRPTLAAYATGTKTPTLSTAERVVHAAGFDLEPVPVVEFAEVPLRGGRMAPVPSHLPRLPLDQAFARIELPLHLNWSQPDRVFDLSDRRQRARVYEIVLREGTAEDIRRYIDGALLMDLWPELVLPTELRQAWERMVDHLHSEAA